MTRLKEELLKALGDNLICLLHTGSRVRGEAAEESDYDVFLVLKSIDSSGIQKMQKVFSNYPNLSAYTVSEHEFKTLPQAQLLQLLYFNQRKRHNLGVQLLKILDDWDTCKNDVAREPKSYLFLLEKFFRECRP